MCDRHCLVFVEAPQFRSLMSGLGDNAVERADSNDFGIFFHEICSVRSNHLMHRYIQALVGKYDRPSTYALSRRILVWMLCLSMMPSSQTNTL